MWSIPAHAGEPRQPMQKLHGPAVYPRACGGTKQLPGERPPRPGLSPRMRGNPLPPLAFTTDARSIPAHAGEPSACACKYPMLTVYPRACGGTWVCPERCIEDAGLSPRMRGNPGGVVGPSGPTRSIPAHAGEPNIVIVVGPKLEVYPRACGGTNSAMSSWARCVGLSPRMRGNPLPTAGVGVAKRSIPAHAGEPSGHLRLSWR